MFCCRSLYCYLIEKQNPVITYKWSAQSTIYSLFRTLHSIKFTSRLRNLPESQKQSYRKSLSREFINNDSVSK